MDLQAHGLHVAFVAVSSVMAWWTLYLDLRYFYGWQGGAWMMKFTHWSFIATLVFLSVSLLDAITLGQVFGSFRRWFLYLALVLAINVDTGFFAVIFPRRISGKDTNFTGSPLSPSSAHKHLINLLWILGEAATHPAVAVSDKPFLARHSKSEMVMFGLITPIFLSGLYYRIAKAIKDPEYGSQFLQVMGIPQPGDFSDYDPTDATTRGNCTAIPGHWIYGSFKHKKLRSLFLLSSIVYLPIAAFQLFVAENLIGTNRSMQLGLLVLATLITPILYFPDVWERENQSIKAVFDQMHQDFITSSKSVLERQQNIGEKLSSLPKLAPAALNEFVSGTTSNIKMVLKDAMDFAEELQAKLKKTTKRRKSSKRKSSKRDSQPRLSGPTPIFPDPDLSLVENILDQ